MAPDDRLSAIQHYLTEIGTNTDRNEEVRQNALASARSLCIQLETPMETLLRFAWIEPTHAACLKVAVDVGLFDALGKLQDRVHRTTEELALSTKTDVKLLDRVLRSLASMNTIAEVGNGTFAATELSTALQEHRYSSAVDYRYMIANPLCMYLPQFLKETKYQNPNNLLDSPWQYALRTKLSFFEWLGQSPEVLEMFTNHMAGYTSQRGTWESVYPIRERLFGMEEGIENVKDIILADLGGGSGHDLKRFATNFLPGCQKPCLVLQDLEDVVNKAKNSQDLPPSINIASIDLTKESPVFGARAYFMHSVLHDWPDQEVQKILQQMHGTLLQKTPDGYRPRLLLNENVLLKRGVPPQPAALDVIMMGAFASHERTEDQWTTLLTSAGYKIMEIFSRPGVDEAVIEAVAIPP